MSRVAYIKWWIGRDRFSGPEDIGGYIYPRKEMVETETKKILSEMRKKEHEIYKGATPEYYEIPSANKPEPIEVSDVLYSLIESGEFRSINSIEEIEKKEKELMDKKFLSEGI